MKKLLFYFAIIMLPSALYALSGSGSQVDPWIIQNEDDLVTIMDEFSYWDDHIEIDLTSGTYLDMSGKSCSAIGTSLEHFTGHFDGKNVEIRNLDIGATNLDNQGLFGYIEYPSTVQNVILKDVSITGDEYVGGLCGRNKGGTISFCSSSGEVNGTKRSGGLCGSNRNHDNGSTTYIGTIANCSSSCDVDNEERAAGGLCGQNYSADILNSFSSGDVKCGGTDRNSIAGGFIGVNQGSTLRKPTILNCYSTGNVEADYNLSNYNEGGRVGGFCGGNMSGIIENSYSTGNATGNRWVGGFSGDNSFIGPYGSSIIKNCYSTGDAEGYVVGGFCGMSGGSDFENCYSTGDAEGEDYVGGFCGSAAGAGIEKCYSTGDAEGEDYVGGFIGRVEVVEIEKCYSTGMPVAASATNEGGFIGYRISCDITCCFWNTSTSGKNDAVGNGSDDGITGLNNSQFSDQSYFESCLDFNYGTWMMTSGGPVLTELTIPTLSEWAAIGFIGLLAGIGGIFIWRKIA